jgi:hypothetical protein
MLDGGSGGDTLDGGPNGDVLFSGWNNSNEPANTLLGGDGDDEITSSDLLNSPYPVDNICEGGNGSDVLWGDCLTEVSFP